LPANEDDDGEEYVAASFAVTMVEARADHNLALATLAEDDLNSTQLVAPLTGTIMSLDFTIADLAQKNIEIYLDETDRDKVVVGYPAAVDVIATATLRACPSLHPKIETHYCEFGSGEKHQSAQLTEALQYPRKVMMV